MLKSLNALIEKGKAGHKLAEKEFYPDFNVSFEYMQRDRVGMEPGDDMYSLGVTFNLPVQRERRQAMVAESSSEITMATEELNSLKNSINAGISDLLAQLERRRKLVELYKTGIIPQAEQSLESATIGYRVNKVDFLTLLDNRMTLFNYERELYDSLADYQMKLAQLEALVGVELLSSAENDSSMTDQVKILRGLSHGPEQEDRNPPGGTDSGRASGGGWYAGSIKATIMAPRVKAAQGKQLYTCSMHPFIIKDKPGTCPICGMELIKKIEGRRRRRRPDPGAETAGRDARPCLPLRRPSGSWPTSPPWRRNRAP